MARQSEPARPRTIVSPSGETRLPLAGRTLLAALAGAVILCVGMGLRQSFGLFQIPISQDLQLGREAFGAALATQNIVWGLAQPFAGAVADRFGAGRVVALSGLLYVAGLALAAVSSDAAGLNLTLGLLIGLGLSGTTFAVVLGAVGRMMPDDRRSLGLGIATAGGSIGMFAFVPAGQALLATLGWIDALLVLSLLAGLTVILAAALAGRPDAGTGPAALRQSLRQAIAEARGHSGYWLLTLGFFVCGFHVTFIAVHLPAFLIDQGLTPAVGAAALATVGVANIASGLFAGFCGDRFRKKYLLSLFYLGRAVVIAGFLILPLTETTAIVFAALIGLLWLGTVPLTSALVAQIFGARYLSTLFGFVFFSHQVGAALGAYAGGAVYDLAGSYTPVWVAAIILGLIAAALHYPIADAPVARLRQAPA